MHGLLVGSGIAGKSSLDLSVPIRAGRCQCSCLNALLNPSIQTLITGDL